MFFYCEQLYQDRERQSYSGDIYKRKALLTLVQTV